jgi:hypothetical protein
MPGVRDTMTGVIIAVHRLEEDLAAADVTLTEAEVAQLTDLSSRSRSTAAATRTPSKPKPTSEHRHGAPNPSGRRGPPCLKVGRSAVRRRP